MDASYFKLCILPSLSEVGEEINEDLGDGHVLATVVVREIRVTPYQGLSQHIGQVLPSHAAQPLYNLKKNIYYRLTITTRGYKLILKLISIL